MAVFFDKVSRFYHVDLDIPQRATSDSAGYDFQVAEDIVIPPFDFHRSKIQEQVFESGFHDDYFGFVKPFTLAEMADVTKNLKARPTLVSTGMKCHLDKGQYLELTVRSSTPLKHWLIMANGVGIVDADYYDNTSNEGEIMFPLINLSPFAIALKRGDKIGQGIIKSYIIVDDDIADGERNGGFGSTNE